ncbi:sulfate transporter [Gluconobacter japonicus]|nr:sulfate transporter [Gluconobacter japonicus]
MSHNLDDYMKDSAGRFVPRANVKPEDLLQDELVKKLFERARAIRELMRQFREDADSDIRAFLDLLAEQYGAKKGGAKGNLTLSTYDGCERVTIAISDTITFGPELQIAKELVDSCLTRWTEGGNANIRAVVTDAFDVGKEGKLNVSKILGLRRLSIDDEEWKRAMQAITDAVKVNASRSYIRFHERASPDGAFIQVPLDIAKA